ncbi:ribokinase [Pseudactinotalea suaedae]|uniref:ribokinase n=1 Tax=Pseudactinotalea suaedae TaxID=1524924 RepID=UPI0012E0FC56|nr:ribokinase [Pseudactinotalea suaedae]
MKVFVLASFMYDLVATAPVRPQPGQTVVGTHFETFVGGKGFNQAVAARRAGADVTVLGRLGDDAFGEEFREFLHAEGIAAEHVIADAAAGTGVGLPVVETGGQNSIVIVPRANQQVTRHDVAAASAAIAGADVLLVQLELPVAAILAAVRIAHASEVTVVLNPAPYVELPPDLLAMVDVLVPNEGELRELAGAAAEADIDQVAREYWHGRRGAMVVTLGEDGVLLLDGDAPPERIPARSVAAIDTIGAGDTFCGNLGARLAAGENLRDAVVAANAAAALSVLRRGGAPAAPTAAETADALAHPDDPPALAPSGVRTHA